VFLHFVYQSVRINKYIIWDKCLSEASGLALKFVAYVFHIRVTTAAGGPESSTVTLEPCFQTVVCDFVVLGDFASLIV
jgi:hypothetical protein